MATKGTSLQFYYNAYAVPRGLLPSFYLAVGWRMYLSSMTFDNIAASMQNINPPNRDSFTEVTPATGNYTAGGIVLTTLAKVAADAAVDGICEIALDPVAHPNNVIEIDSHPSNPTNAKTALFLDNSSTGPLCISAIELTSDNGVTPVNMTTDILRITPDALGVPGRIYYQEHV